MGGANSKGSDSVVVPEDVTKVLNTAIERHCAATPAFDIIRSSFKNKPYTVNSLLTKKPTVLVMACSQAHDDLIEFLLNEMRANPNATLAAAHGRPVLVEIMSKFRYKQCLAGTKALLRAGADPYASGFGGCTPFTAALAELKDTDLREMLMVLATKDGTITDKNTIPVPTSNLQNYNISSPNKESCVYIHCANPLHLAIASEKTIGALVMLELGVGPSAKTGGTDPKTALEIMKEFDKYDQSLYDTIQIIIDDPANAKKATEIYDGLVAAAAAAASAAE